MDEGTNITLEEELEAFLHSMGYEGSGDDMEYHQLHQEFVDQRFGQLIHDAFSYMRKIRLELDEAETLDEKAQHYSQVALYGKF